MDYKIGDIIPNEKIRLMNTFNIDCFKTRYEGLGKCTFEMTEEERNQYFENETDQYYKNSGQPFNVFYCVKIKESLEKGWQENLEIQHKTCISENKIQEGKHRACIAYRHGWDLEIKSEEITNNGYQQYEFKVR
ncbi:hypothetical protein [Cytobacillus praedii]|uniref:hypothetical protein n=1 Tax=Cytobacillus praedii TaxID=1742358 RepID=UPI002E20E3AB|nr:hypothetical protein [Cytobacillus praedii]